MTQIANVLSVAAAFIGIWTLISTFDSQKVKHMVLSLPTRVYF